MQVHLKQKLILSFLMVAFFTTVVSILGIFGMSLALGRLMNVGDDSLPSIDFIWRVNQAQSDARSASRGMLSPQISSDDVNRFKNSYESSIQDMNDYLRKYEPKAKTKEEQDLLATLHQQLDEWVRIQESARGLWDRKAAMIREGAREKNIEAYMALHQDLQNMQIATRQIFNDSVKTLDKLTDFNVNMAKSFARDAQDSVGILRVLMISLSILAIVASIWIGLRIADSTLKLLGTDPSEISDVVKTIASGDTSLQLNAAINVGVYNDIKVMVKGLNDKTGQAEAIATGDLTKEIVLLSERDRLGKSFQTMNRILRDVIRQSNTAANQVSAGSDQVSSASQTLSQGASEQAAAVEEITSSVTEISAKIKTNADDANAASDTAQKAQMAASHGNQQIDVTLKAMTDISISSQEISKIIKAIDDIAFQTNLLALNAAVEAARAGRHGKGFAVVADEVRSLASRSAKAARETTELIESSSRKVDSGLVEARKTVESFKDIVDGSLQVAAIVRKIADASKEQAAAIGQIASGINQINKVTQSTTASAEETASAAEELAGQSRELKRTLAYFRLSEESNETSEGRVIAMRPAPADTDWGHAPADQDLEKYRA